MWSWNYDDIFAQSQNIKSFHQDISIMKNEINQWLNDNFDIQIIQLAQSEIGSKRSRDTVVTILYSESPDSW